MIRLAAIPRSNPFARGFERPLRWVARLAGVCTLLGVAVPVTAAPPAEETADYCETLPPLPVTFRFGTGARPAAPAAFSAEGNVYVGTSEGYVHGLSADGSYLWGYTLRGAVTGRPAVTASGVVLVPTARRVYAIRPDGTLLWVFHSPVRVLGDLVRDGLGRFHFGSEDGRIFALSGRGGLVAHVPGKVPFSVLPVALGDGSIAAARQDGSVLVSRAGKNQRFELGAVARGLFPCLASQTCALAGGELQVLAASGSPFRAPAQRGAGNAELVAALPDDRHVVVYRGLSGERVFALALPDSASAAPLLDARGRLFVPMRGGTLLAVSPAGTPIACVRVARSPLGPPIADLTHGRLLVTALEGVLTSVDISAP